MLYAQVPQERLIGLHIPPMIGLKIRLSEQVHIPDLVFRPLYLFLGVSSGGRLGTFVISSFFWWKITPFFCQPGGLQSPPGHSQIHSLFASPQGKIDLKNDELGPRQTQGRPGVITQIHPDGDAVMVMWDAVRRHEEAESG